ncbi:hypothetical protein CTZ28_25040 [Streptomyces shenzhenensis]|uniref:Uncharacterized protein n=2 Tax=Streptomyces shenzhenensis TaxID=943815 RepID=A0A3M0I4P7_9ACTN|nr:hypothetical protein CTZ28_25040 [Streptomyces shenzhenensis]
MPLGVPGRHPRLDIGRFSIVLPPAPPGLVPYIAGWSEERLLSCPITRRRGFPGIAYADETPYDRDSFGVLWVRYVLRPKQRRGNPVFRNVHPYRQRRAMLNMMCQVCARMPPDPHGPHLFLLKDSGGPIREGELTTSPPVCVPCAGISIQLCRALRGGRFVAAWARRVPAWGVVGPLHHPRTLQPIPGCAMEQVKYGSEWAPWVRAARTMVELRGVTPADLDREFAALGRDRLEEEFARIAALMAVA